VNGAATVCYVCIQPGADSRDHVIPSGFFLEPRPTNLVTLPAHQACHNRHSEDYARAILAGMSDTTTARRVSEIHVRRSLVRSDLKGTKLRRDLVRTLVPRVEFKSPAGLILGHAPAVQFDRERMYPMLEKIVRGLHYHHTGRFLAVNAKLSWGLFSFGLKELHGTDLALFEECDTGLSYAGVFECRYGVASDDTVEGSVWWLRFYEGVVFRCVTSLTTAAAATP
jgi:hypothetical protein